MSSWTGRPTIREASSSAVEVGLASPTTLPRRMTVIRSATARTSRSLWVMKTIEVPASFSDRITSIRSSVSCGVSTAVGSSRIRTWASPDQRLDDLDPLLDADREVLDQRVDRHLQAVALRDLAHLAPGGARC